MCPHIKKEFKIIKAIEGKSFAEKLISWYTDRKRDLPWRKTKDPYPIWLSEIILQQTRVDQGLPYWESFVETFPTVTDLANAPEDQVLRLWQGLGYYSRARNLHATAKYIAQDLGGTFPNSYEGLLKLKGIGPYTAAAIASICFDEAKPVVDGNVFRFASRYFGIQDDISKSGTRKVFEAALEKKISLEHPSAFNQGMMEFGATICTPNPKCDLCDFQPSCYAFSNQLQGNLPVKTAKTKVRTRYFKYAVLVADGGMMLAKREEKDVWAGLFDFYLLEGNLSEEDIIATLQRNLGIKSLHVEDISPTYKHILSHQHILAEFYQIRISGTDADSITQKTPLALYSLAEVLNLPKPKLIVNYLESQGIK